MAITENRGRIFIMLKKLFTLFILLAFCSNYAVFAADPTAINPKSSDAFEDNEQDLKNVNSVKYPLSTIEKMYNGHENARSGNVLRQVGYDQFNVLSTTNAATGKYGPNYKLSIGDKLNIFSYGDSVDVITMSGSNLISPKLTIDIGSTGNVFVPGIGLVKAEDRTLSEVEKELNTIASKKYSHMKIKLQIASGGFSVFVYGEVRKPGKVYISNNSTILDALSAVGGVSKSGTLRNIKYNSKNVDLYDILFLGNDKNIYVKANDKIFVDKIKNTMALKNGVIKPGIYEFKTGETVDDMIKYAGGLLVTTQRDDVTMVSFDKILKQKTAQNVPYLQAKATKLSNGDTFQFKELYNDVENTVTIQGNIKHPATYAYKEGMRLSDILKNEDELREETFIYQAVIRRISGQNNEIETIPVYLKEFFAGMNDPILQPRDVITIYKNTNSSFVDVYGCINTPKHIPYTSNMTLKNILSDIQFMESEVSSTEMNTKIDDNTISQSDKENGDVQIKVSTENSNKLIPAEKIAVEISNASGSNLRLLYLYDIMIRSDAAASIKLQPEDKIFFRTLRDNEIIKTVKISGFVKKPGVYSFVKGQKLTDVIKMAGGLDDDADLRGIVFNRTNVRDKQVATAIKNNEKDIRLLEGRLASGYKQEASAQGMKLTMIEQMKEDSEVIKRQYNGRIALNIKGNDLDKISDVDNVLMQDGDDIYIPRVSNFVSVIGEVYNEQGFIYLKGKNVRYYIKEVGGYTPNANRFRLYKIGTNGRSEKVHMGTKVAAGDTIVVPRKIAGNDWLTPICQTFQFIASSAVMLFAIHRW